MPVSSHSASNRRYPIGAELVADGGVSFRVWAAARERIEVVLEAGPEARAIAWCWGVIRLRLFLRHRWRAGRHGIERYRFQPDGKPERLASTPPRAISPTGRWGRRKWSIRRAFNGLTRHGPARV